MVKKLNIQDKLSGNNLCMPTLDSMERIKGFREVELGLSREHAIQEATRCLQCKSASCVAGCPIRVNIPEFIGALADEELSRAALILQRGNPFPSSCGRVCPQETQCEAKCILAKADAPIAIGALERFVADWTLDNEIEIGTGLRSAASGKKVAVIGSGPAGLTTAAELVLKGHSVKIFEALDGSGGVLLLGIPEFRLPKRIVIAEISRLLSLGVKIECNVDVGKTVTMHELYKEYDAIFVGNGAASILKPGIPGEALEGVYSAKEYLARTNLAWINQRINGLSHSILGRKVIVIGGGNTAIDCARVVRRLGGELVRIVYRRSEEEMPARLKEIMHAKEEGIELITLSSPVRILGDSEGRVTSVIFRKMELGEYDTSGRRQFYPIEGELIRMDSDLVIYALGTVAVPIMTDLWPAKKHGNKIVVYETGETEISGIYMGGDNIRTNGTVAQAIADGKKAASAIHTFFAPK
ncbi:MAG: NAD(P)-dependent oxidoreductase [Geobacteraceae bacterium]